MNKHSIVKVPGKNQWLVRGLNTGRILGRHPSREKAEKQLEAIEWRMHGSRPRRRTDFSRHRIFKLR